VGYFAVFLTSHPKDKGTIGYTSSTGLRNSKNLVPKPPPGIGCCPPISRFVDAFLESNGAENLEFWSKVAYFERFGSDE